MWLCGVVEHVRVGVGLWCGYGEREIGRAEEERVRGKGKVKALKGKRRASKFLTLLSVL